MGVGIESSEIPAHGGGGGGGSSPLTTKGDVYGYSSADARIPVGTNGQVLTADSAQTLGLKWATPAASGVSSVSGSSPISSTGGATPAISIADAAADGATKGAASFAANDFNAASGVISLDYANAQAADASHKGFLTSADWSTFNGKAEKLVSQAVSSNITLAANKVHLVNTSAVRSLTLPAVVANLHFFIKDVSGLANTNPISVLQSAAESIEGVAATKTLQTNGGAWHFWCDGTDWWLI